MPGEGVGGKILSGDKHNGQLMRISHGTFTGTCRIESTGQMDRKRFVNGDWRAAVREYEEWCARVRERDMEKRRRLCGYKGGATAETAKTRPEPKEPERGEKSMKTTDTAAAQPKLYALAVVGGATLYVFDNEDKAFAVCDALTAAAKASGFAAKYDVTEVKRWVD